MQRRQGRELVGGFAFQHAGEKRHRGRGDVVVSRQHPGRRYRVQPEHDQADDVARDESVAVQAERWHPPPDQRKPHGRGHGALQRHVEPGCRDAGGRVGDQPVVHRLSDRTAELVADDDHGNGVLEPGQRRLRAKTVDGVQPPQHDPHRDDLRIPQAPVPGCQVPQSPDRMPPQPAFPCRAAAAGDRDTGIKRGSEPLSGGCLHISLRLAPDGGCVAARRYAERAAVLRWNSAAG